MLIGTLRPMREHYFEYEARLFIVRGGPIEHISLILNKWVMLLKVEFDEGHHHNFDRLSAIPGPLPKQPCIWWGHSAKPYLNSLENLWCYTGWLKKKRAAWLHHHFSLKIQYFVTKLHIQCVQHLLVAVMNFKYDINKTVEMVLIWNKKNVLFTIWFCSHLNKRGI